MEIDARRLCSSFYRAAKLDGAAARRSPDNLFLTVVACVLFLSQLTDFSVSAMFLVV